MELSKEWYHTELANSEYEMLHRSPTVEYSFYNAVKTGDMDSVIRNCKEDAFIDLKGTGVLSRNSCTTVRQVADLHHEMVKDFTGKMILQKKSSILSKPVMQCVDYIYTHIKERITITTLAEYTGLSESYLSRVFKQNLGISISDYIREKKIEKATHLLRYSDKPIVDIANYLSFSSQSHFIQIFENYTGLTPKKYRDKYYKSMW